MRARPRTLRLALTAVLATGLLAAAAGPASADDLEVDGDELEFTDTDGDSRSLTVTATRESITFANEAGDTIDVVGNVCEDFGTNVVTCTPDDGGVDAFDDWSAFMGNGNDTVVANGELGGEIFGQEGADSLTGSATNGNREQLFGGPDNDQIDSRNVGPALVFEELGAGGDGGNGFDDSGSDDVYGGDGNDQLTTGDGDDYVNGDGEPFIVLSAARLPASRADGFPEGGAPGADVISTGPGDDYADGGSGADQISTGAGGDFATGGRGDGDQLNLGEGEDLAFLNGDDGSGDNIDAGPGIDTIALQGANQILLAAGSDGEPVPDAFAVNLATGVATRTNNTPASHTIANFEDVLTSYGDDVVVGNDASNVIETGFGSDNVNPGAGADTVYLDFGSSFLVNSAGDGRDGLPAPAGNDSANLVDGFADRVHCGDGTDTVAVDQFDTVASDCENVTKTETPVAGPGDVVAPDCTIERVRRNYGRRAFLRGFPIRVGCDEQATLTIQLIVPFSKKLITSRVGDLVLAQKTVTLGGANATTRIRPAKKFRRALRNRRFRARIDVEARDQTGNRSVERRTVRVKKAGKKRKKRRRG